MPVRRVLVSGLVQGVAFRYHAREEARARGLTGWVRNLPDGRVETLFGGESEGVEAFLAWLRLGPPAARVSSIEVREDASLDPRELGEGSFEITR